MNENYIFLIEKYFDKTATPEEIKRIESLLTSNKEFKKEFDEQKKIKEIFKSVNLKNPKNEFWDSYWLSLYNRFERKIAWAVIIISSLLLLGYAAFQIVEQILYDTQTPIFVKVGLAFLIFGIVLLFLSILREKIKTNLRDKYKEIQR